MRGEWMTNEGAANHSPTRRWLSIITNQLMDIIWKLWMISHLYGWQSMTSSAALGRVIGYEVLSLYWRREHVHLTLHFLFSFFFVETEDQHANAKWIKIEPSLHNLQMLGEEPIIRRLHSENKEVAEICLWARYQKRRGEEGYVEKKPEIYHIARFRRHGRSESRERDRSPRGTQRFERSDEASIFGHQIERAEIISVESVDVENFCVAVFAWRWFFVLFLETEVEVCWRFSGCEWWRPGRRRRRNEQQRRAINMRATRAGLITGPMC